MAGTATFNVVSAPTSLRGSSFISLTTKPSLLSMRPLSGYPRIFGLTSNDIKVGTNLEVDGAPWRVFEFLHVKPGKGAAFVRTKLRNYMTGTTVEGADVFKETKQFRYKDGSMFVFMDLNTFEEFCLNAMDVGDKKKWLKEGMDCNLLFWKGKVIDFEHPITVQLTVVDVDPGLNGDTALGGSKRTSMDTGAVVNVVC